MPQKQPSCYFKYVDDDEVSEIISTGCPSFEERMYLREKVQQLPLVSLLILPRPISVSRLEPYQSFLQLTQVPAFQR